MRLDVLRAGARVFCVLAAVLVASAGCKSDARGPADPGPDSTETVTLALQPATVTLRDTLGRPDPAAVSVEITNAGVGSLTGLSLGPVAYNGSVADWLTAELSGADAPATLTLRAKEIGLRSGVYTATVPVLSSAASNSPQNVTVTFDLAPPRRPDPIPGAVVLSTGNTGDCNGGLNRATADVVASANPDYLILLGDILEPIDGRAVALLDDFQRCYDPVWGRFKDITYVALGRSEVDHDMASPTAGLAPGADAYFGPTRVGPPGQNWFSFDIGSWHVIILNIQGGGPTVLPANIRYNSGSDQLRWLDQDLRAHPNQCTIAFFHEPMWISSSTPESPTDPNPNHSYRQQSIRGVWTVLYERGADVVVNGSRHVYERFAPMRYAEGYQNPTPSEFAEDSVRGIRQFTSGLAGDGPLDTPEYETVHPLSDYLSGGNGVLKLTLGDGEYTWEFLNTRYSNVEDWGHGTCH